MKIAKCPNGPSGRNAGAVADSWSAPGLLWYFFLKQITCDILRYNLSLILSCRVRPKAQARAVQRNSSVRRSATRGRSVVSINLLSKSKQKVYSLQLQKKKKKNWDFQRSEMLQLYKETEHVGDFIETRITKPTTKVRFHNCNVKFYCSQFVKFIYFVTCLFA